MRGLNATEEPTPDQCEARGSGHQITGNKEPGFGYGGHGKEQENREENRDQTEGDKQAVCCGDGALEITNPDRANDDCQDEDKEGLQGGEGPDKCHQIGFGCPGITGTPAKHDLVVSE